MNKKNKYRLLQDIIDAIVTRYPGLGSNTGSELSQSDLLRIFQSITSSELMRNDWLVDTMEQYIDYPDPDFCIAAGGFGVTAFHVRQRYPRSPIVSFELNSDLTTLAKTLFSNEAINFKRASMANYSLSSKPHNVIVCTSCAHLKSTTLRPFLSDRRRDSVIVMQASSCCQIGDCVAHPESLLSFIDAIAPLLTEVFYRGSLSLDESDWYMVIAK